MSKKSRKLEPKTIQAINNFSIESSNRKRGVANLLSEYEDLLYGIRNDYLNIYHNGSRISKIEYMKADKYLRSETHVKYLENHVKGKLVGDKGSYKQFKIQTLFEEIENIIDKIKKNHTITKNNIDLEKTSQHKMFLANNNNPNSEYYCIDIEYIMHRKNNTLPNNGRFDIVALSRNKIKGKYKAALIELKYGNRSYRHYIKEELDSSKSIGSGIAGHIENFNRMMSDNENGYRQKLIEDICNIANDLKAIGVCDVWNEKLTSCDIHEDVEFYLITVGCDNSTPRHFKKYLPKNVDFKVENFLFTKECDGSNIDDIINFKGYKSFDKIYI